jgi:hypothetical protein
MWNCPYSNDSFPTYAEDIDGGASPSADALAAAAAANAVTLVGGSIPERSEDRLYNTCLVFSREGALLAKHRKVRPTPWLPCCLDAQIMPRNVMIRCCGSCGKLKTDCMTERQQDFAQLADKRLWMSVDTVRMRLHAKCIKALKGGRMEGNSHAKCWSVMGSPA